MLVYVYGAYGACLDAEYKPEWLPLLERGWVRAETSDPTRRPLCAPPSSFGRQPHYLARQVIALAHVRGGSELGSSWHRAGRLKQKGTSASDLVDVVQSLHRSGATRRDEQNNPPRSTKQPAGMNRRRHRDQRNNPPG